MDLSGFKIEKILAVLFKVSKIKGLPFVFYRFPKCKNIEVIVGLNPVFDYEIKYNGGESGFVFSPYRNFDNTKSIFIPSSIRFNSDNKKLIISDIDNIGISDIKELIESLLNNKGDFKKVSANRPGTKRILQNTPDYSTLVESGINEIKNQKFQKVVLASQKQIKLEPDFDETETFLKLCEKYTNGFISYVSIPEIGDWLGATPELLVHINHKVLRAVALAGTKTIKSGNVDEVFWTQKEYLEQQMVEDYVEDALHQSGFASYKSNGPNTVKAGSLVHLLTEFEAELTEADENKISELLKNIHPTPAICGLPKVPAQEFISKYEKFDREFYAGYLGPVNMNDSMDLFVNLRCMQILGDTAMLYAGAGIISDSTPENEFLEIESKFMTMQSVIEKPLKDKVAQNM